MRLFLAAFFICALFFPFPLPAQAGAAPSVTAPAGDVPAGASGTDAEPPPPGPPGNFREFGLGMDLGALRSALEKDRLFNFRGDRDVSFLPNRDQSLIETTGFSFIRRAFFQLRDGKLFIMAFNLDTGL
ncbi:MAG: hypothetical protein LBL20_05475, partial [Treponema sp.]|nr:hypothetical protein [Treponema sp.]